MLGAPKKYPVFTTPLTFKTTLARGINYGQGASIPPRACGKQDSQIVVIE